MEKIILKQVYLLNWYGYVDKTIPIGENLTLITGKNKSGKSVIIDAIRYVYSGDTSFNRSSKSIGKRNLKSYTRCLLVPGTKKYARSESDVYTHIALELYSQKDKFSYVLGVVIETNYDDVTSHWYALDKTTLENVVFTKRNEGKKYALSYREFRDLNKAVIINNKNEALVKFMQMNRLNLRDSGMIKYRAKLRNLLTYDPKANIDDFIRNSVLEEKNVELKFLKDQKLAIDETNKLLEKTGAEIKIISKILKDLEDYRVLKKISQRMI